MADAAELKRFTHLGRNVVIFGRVLRRLGLAVQPDRIILLDQALDAVGMRSRADVKAAARSVIVRKPEEIPTFDAAFELFWSKAVMPAPDPGAPPDTNPAIEGDPRKSPPDVHGSGTQAAQRQTTFVHSDGSGYEPPDERAEAVDGDRSFTYSFAEGLYQKELSNLSDDEAERARELTRRHVWELGTKRSRRMRHGEGAGAFDYRRTLRASLRRGGEALALITRRRKRKQRDLVLLCDISGSMDRYARLLLQFVHTVRHSVGRVEAFVFGTRLTRITRQIRHRDIRAALDDVSASVADWAGGTRIGECLRAFNLKWANRVLGRGAIVLIISDGWDRGDIDLLAAEMKRLQRGAYRLIWLNPLLGSPRYRPQTVGMQAALPYIDNFLSAHNLRSLMQLADLLNTVEDRRPVRAQRIPA
ncbi:MAG: VWA domain-containing protein [Candidatus Eremiobacteraeota bacterium]|nr:VWA domain-containing protein [Candidatus Eremiobacteraeota bacterium]MBV8222159.1 VWA domain-containing protein [Candidatus Eremiobacteraeota bacterium]